MPICEARTSLVPAQQCDIRTRMPLVVLAVAYWPWEIPFRRGDPLR